MENIIDEWGLLGLFISSFISSTLLPGGSEAILVALRLNDAHEPLALLAVATTGNTLGGLSSWLIGFLLARLASAASKADYEKKSLQASKILKTRMSY